MRRTQTFLLTALAAPALAAGLAGCAHTHEVAGIHQQYAAPAPALGYGDAPREVVVVENRMTEAQRAEWFAENAPQRTYRRPPQHVEVVTVERPVVVRERPVVVRERAVWAVPSPYLNVGYGFGRGYRHRRRGHWHGGIGWTVPIW